MKTLNEISRRGALTGLVLAALLFPAFAAAQDQVTLMVHCSDGVVDSDWRIVMEITDPAGRPLGTVTQYVPTHATASSAAEGLADQIRRKFNAGGTKVDKPTAKKCENLPNQGKDLILPAGFKIGKVTTEKKPWEGGTWSPSHGHLEVIRGDQRINNRTRQKAASDDAVKEPLGKVTLSVLGSTAELTKVELILSGTWSDGTPLAATFANSYPRGTPTWQILLDLGQFATNNGILVSYSSSTAVTLDLETVYGAVIDGWWFTAFPYGTDPATGGTGGEGRVSFSATSAP